MMDQLIGFTTARQPSSAIGGKKWQFHFIR